MNLRELAEYLNLSQTTVSRALNGYPEVAESTRLRVMHASKQFNYVPNARAQSLATGRNRTISHVISSAQSAEMVTPAFGDFIAGVGAVYGAHGYDFSISVVSCEDAAQTYQTLGARGTVAGFVLHSPTRNDPRIPLLRDMGLPFVVHGRASQVRTPYSWVDVNHSSAFHRATDFLLDLGHRRIGLINGAETLDFAYRRRQGVEQALDARGIALAPDLMTSGEMTESFGYQAASAMLAHSGPPTAILASSMMSALGIRRAADERGLALGRALSVVCFDDDLSFLRNTGAVPLFTATRASVREAGMLVAKTLIGRIESPGTKPVTHLLETELIAGASTGPANA